MSGKQALDRLIGSSPAMREVRRRIARFAPSPIPLLLLGETGTGKSLCAEVVWKLSGLRAFASLNCGGLPDTLLESELFGHRKGAFTGADRDRRGVLAQADGGILFLDEVSELHARAQAALLTALDRGEYRRLGSERTSRSRFRLLAATNADLDQRVEEGSFREDLRQRLGSVSIHIPPLRERPEDVADLTRALLRHLQKETKRKQPLGIARECLRFLEEQPWPGNVRQLRNVLESAATLAELEDRIQLEHLREILPSSHTKKSENPQPVRRAGLGTRPTAVSPETSAANLPNLDEIRLRVEYAAIRDRLRHMTVGQAAASLGVSRATLYRILKKGRAFGLDKQRGEDSHFRSGRSTPLD